MSGEDIQKIRDLKRQREPLWCIAKKMHCSISTVFYYTRDLKRINRKPWTEDETKRLVEAMKQNLSFEDMAKITGHPKLSCRKRYYEFRNASVEA